ncbi:MAG: hypothetical protein RL088_223 [Verrucomicrobiota bacterium]
MPLRKCHGLGDSRSRRAGITIVEVAVAAAFLVVCAVGVFSTLTRMQQSAITNRSLTNAHNLLRTVIEQALSRGWDNEAAPLDILAPTIAGDTLPYNSSSNVGDGTWKQWDVYRAIDAAVGTDPLIPIYEDVSDVSKNVPARVFRKVQRVTGNSRLLWITFRIEYVLRGQLIGQEAWVTRAAD